MAVKIHPSLRAIALAAPLALAGMAGATAVSAQDFEAVLAAPDDVELNLAFAREQARQGNLSVAASTLERLLINEPNRHSVRLFYAVVLYRLGDLQNARAQLDQLETAPLTPQQRAEASAYSGRVDDGLATSSFSGSLGVGVVYEDNASGAYFTQFDFFGAPPEESGTSSEVALSLEGRTNIGSSRMWEAFARTRLVDRSNFDGAGVDFQRGDLEVGLTRTTRLTEMNMAVIARQVRLEGEPNLTEFGGRADFGWRYTNALTVRGHVEAVDQDFEEPLIDFLSFVLGGDRDGTRFNIGASVNNRFTARSSFDLGVDYEAKDADYAPFGYSGPRVWGAFDHRFDKGVYVTASGSIRWVEYDEEDPFFLGVGITREDTRANARIAVGAPLSAFTAAGTTGDYREDVVLEGALTYGSRDSTSPIADFDGWGADLRLVWRFGANN